MKEHPILFSAPMVKAILEGRKSMTRRVMKPQPIAINEPTGNKDTIYTSGFFVGEPTPKYMLAKCPYGQPGDRLWVRETCADVNTESGPAILYRADNHYRFCTDDAYPVEYERYPKCQFTMWGGDLLRGEPEHHWRTPIFMPRWASRITLEITNVRVERLQEMPWMDALKEGVEDDPRNKGGSMSFKDYLKNIFYFASPKESFRTLWDSINGKKYPWSSNPWVWVVGFKRFE